MRLPPQFEIKIEKLVFGGEGLGYYDNRPVFVYGVLPEEVVKVRPVQVRRKFAKAAPVEILEPSPLRKQAKDDHFLTCGPWQIIPYDQQLEFKKSAVIEMWHKLAKDNSIDDVVIVSSPLEWNYRNKLEFSFVEEDGKLSLAFHQRYRFNAFYRLDQCHLGHQKINDLADKIVEELNQRRVTISQVKNLMLRYSFYEDRLIAVLYVKDKNFVPLDIEVENVTGWVIVYSDPESPATIETEILHAQGCDYLTEQIAGIDLRFRFSSFFQINPPAFEAIIRFLQKKLGGKHLLDLYAGVGTIGFALSKKFSKITSLELDSGATKLAQSNIHDNRLQNVEIVRGAAEKQDLDRLLRNADTVIVDPPRSGLHPKLIKKILEHRPKNLIYVSCNPSTQARDWAFLKNAYKVNDAKLFDLYPQTPHVESVIVAEIKSPQK